MRIAVVGLGSIGRRHVRVLYRYYPTIEIIAVRSGRGGTVPEDALVTRHVRTPVDALEHELAAAVVASPAPFHVDQALEFLRAGVPVLIEKPIAASYTDARRLMDEPSIDPLALSISAVGYVLRHQPAFDFVRDTVKSGRLGALRSARVIAHSYLPSWRPDQDYKESVSARTDLGGGVLRELSHEVDYVLELLGRPINVIAWHGRRSDIEIDADDHGELMMKHAGDSLATISLDFATEAPPRRDFSATFSKGALAWDLVGNVVRIEAKAEEPIQRVFPVERDEMFAAQLKDFLEAIAERKTPKCTISDGVDTMAIIDAAERSYVSHRWETI